MAAVAVAAMIVAAMPVQAERIKDITDIQGIRGNPLEGYGLVIGLNGTGDDSEPSRRAMANWLRRNPGLVLDPNATSSKNIASVIVTAELGPFSRKDSAIDVTISAIGNASSLQGGTLLQTKLQGFGGTTYAVAQGNIVIGGYTAAGENASVSKNHTTVGSIPGGATVEVEELATFVEKGKMTLQLRNADFATAQNIAEAVNGKFANCAVAEDAGTVVVNVPRNCSKAELSKFIAAVGAMDVKVDYPAVVVINEKTGTVIIGDNVKISLVGISYGSLAIIKKENESVSQPPPFSRGNTQKTTDTDVQTVEGNGPLRVIPRQVSVSELVQALNKMGLTPRDLIAIFQELKKAGALQAELKWK